MNAKVILNHGRERSVLKRHPWIFSGGIKTVEGNPRPGDTVDVYADSGELLARGAYAPDSAIRVKLWTFQADQRIDEEFFRERISQAYQLRRAVFGGELPEAYRLVNAESDGLPCFVADVYRDYAVCQFTGAAMEHWRDTAAKILLEYVKGVYERSDVDSRKKDGLEFRTGPLAGAELPAQLEFIENGILFHADPRGGHKTGFYLDQRFSRLAVQRAAAGAQRVLNCFSYTGGFGLSALKGGAAHVVNVDSSAPALALALQNALDNGFTAEKFETVEADVFQYLRKCRDSRKTFDLIVLDPPKFAETMAQREKAARAYKDINLLAMKLLEPGGRLFTFSCSGAMDADLFGKVVDSAACDAGRDFRIVQWLNQGPDHPVSARFPEGRYLKGISGIVF